MRLHFERKRPQALAGRSAIERSQGVRDAVEVVVGWRRGCCVEVMSCSLLHRCDRSSMAEHWSRIEDQSMDVIEYRSGVRRE